MKIIVCLFVFFSFNSLAVDYELNLVDKDLNIFVSWFSDRTNTPVVIDKDINAKVTVFARKGIAAKDLYSLFTNVLNSQGLSFKIEHNIYRIYKTKLNLSPDDLITDFYDFKNISGDSVEKLVPVFTSLIQNLISEHYISDVKSSDLNVNSKLTGSRKFTVESLFSGRSILVTAPRFVHDHLKPLFIKFDSPLPQILVRAVVVESSFTDINELGVKWLFTKSNTQFGQNSSVTFENALGLLIANNGFDAALSIIDKTDNVSIKSVPQLTVLHGHHAKINVGQNVPFLSGSTVSSGVNSGNPYQTINRQDVGLILDVFPLVSSDSITLDVKQELSSISADSGASDLITDKRAISSTLKLKSGDSVVLGGLVSKQITDSVSGIPFLMDLPFFGSIFTNTSKKDVTRNLSVAIEVTLL
jgi:general secretion pathway protein D